MSSETTEKHQVPKTMTDWALKFQNII